MTYLPLTTESRPAGIAISIRTIVVMMLLASLTMAQIPNSAEQEVLETEKVGLLR